MRKAEGREYMDKVMMSNSRIIARQGFSASFLLNKLNLIYAIQQNERMGDHK